MISIHLERHIVAILACDERELTVDEIVQRLRRLGQFPAANNNLDVVRREIHLFVQGYFHKQVEIGESS